MEKAEKKLRRMNTGRELSLQPDRNKMTVISPQMNEVAQGASLTEGEGLPAGLIICVTANGNGEGPLA